MAYCVTGDGKQVEGSGGGGEEVMGLEVSYF